MNFIIATTLYPYRLTQEKHQEESNAFSVGKKKIQGWKRNSVKNSLALTHKGDKQTGLQLKKANVVGISRILDSDQRKILQVQKQIEWESRL